MLRWLAIGAAAAFAPPTRPPRRQAVLHAETQAPSWKALRPRPGDVVLIDGDNCRGKSKWRLSAADVDAAAAGAHARGLLGQETILVLDHGERRDCFVTEPGAYATAFAGRRGTADDAIVDCVEHFLEHNRTLTVVTSDFGLRARASYVAARAIRGAPEGGRRRSPETLVRFARSEAFADAALADATVVQSAHAAAFDEAVDRLAKHVLTAPSSMRARMRRRARPPLVEGSPLGNEQTWMRVVLAERLRWLLARDAAAPRGPLADFANWFAEEEDLEDAPRVLTHRLTDRKHRHELLRFADALRRRPPPDAVEEEAEEEERTGGRRRRAPRSRSRATAACGASAASASARGSSRASSGARARRRARRPRSSWPSPMSWRRRCAAGCGTRPRPAAAPSRSRPNPRLAAARSGSRPSPTARSWKIHFIRNLDSAGPTHCGASARTRTSRSGRTGTRTTTM